MHIFPNGKRYIGLTKMNPEKRWNDGNGYKKQYIYEGIKEFGWDNIKHIIIATNLTCIEASDLEQELIEKYDTIKNGYNRTNGGEYWSGLPIYYTYNGQKYTAYELSEKFNISYYCFKWRLSKGWSVEDAVEIPQEDKMNTYNYNDHMYSIYELAEINGTGITPHGIQSRINRGWSIKDAVEKPLVKNTTTKIRTINGTYYSSKDLLKMSNVDGLTEKNISYRLSKGWSIERTLNQSKNVKIQPFGLGEKIYEYNGEKYNSYELSKINPSLNLAPSDITMRINYLGWSIERAISQPKKNRGIKFKYNGKLYSSHELANICVDKKMKHHDVTDRYRNGWSIEEIINIPKGITRKQYKKQYNL